MKWMMILTGALAFSAAALAQTGGKADVFSSSAVRAKIAELTPQSASAGSAGAVLADYGSHKVQISVRSTSGGAEVHAHFDDIMIVQQGTATLITGGTIPDAKTGADGETHGTSIQGGKTQTLGVGDVVTVNAGVPHQLLVPAGTTYAAIVFKVKE